jgi:hypothetical protein
MQRADEGGQFERNFLNRVDHFFVLFDDLRDVVDRGGQFI